MTLLSKNLKEEEGILFQTWCVTRPITTSSHHPYPSHIRDKHSCTFVMNMTLLSVCTDIHDLLKECRSCLLSDFSEV